MLASPALYNVGADYMEGDPSLAQKRCQSFWYMSRVNWTDGMPPSLSGSRAYGSRPARKD
jgi:hypothetical protein